MSMCQSVSHCDAVIIMRYGEQKIAQFRTHYLTKESAYVSTQQSGDFPIDTEMI